MVRSTASIESFGREAVRVNPARVRLLAVVAAAMIIGGAVATVYRVHQLEPRATLVAPPPASVSAR